MPKAMRERIVIWKNEMGKNTNEIAKLAGCCERTVRNILRYEREYGVVSNPFARNHAGPRVLNTGDTTYITSILQARPVLYLDEVQTALLEVRNVDVCLATISRTLQRLAITNKQVAPEAVERNELLRATWQAAYGDIPAEYCIWLDESSVDNRTNQRTRGWAEVGRACVRRELFIRGQRYSVLPAFTCDGYIALDIFEGAVNKERFITFLWEQIVSFGHSQDFNGYIFLIYLGPQVKPIPRPT
jgi:transposase